MSSDPYQEAFNDVLLKESIRLLILRYDLSKCSQCQGTGHVDSGGFSPWGTGIDRPCPSCYPNLQ
jgi:hypothetical protein